MGTPLYEPFDEDLLGPLCPQVKIVSSVSAGYNDFDVEWMTSQNVIFCNSRNAVCEPTADMAILMILAVLRNVKTLENTMKQGLWRGTLGEHAPTDDPNGKTLGLIGLGAIGKVSQFSLFLPRENRLHVIARRQKGASFQLECQVLSAHSTVPSGRGESRCYLLFLDE